MWDKIKNFFSRIWEKVAPVAKTVGKVAPWIGVGACAIIVPLAAVAAAYCVIWGIVAIFTGTLSQVLWLFLFAIVAGIISAVCGGVVAMALEVINHG